MNKYQKICVTGFLIHEGKVLIIRRASHEKFLAGYYELPGEKVDFGESPEDALQREFIEEVNLKVKVIKPYSLFSYISDEGNRHTVDIQYILELNDDPQNIKLSKAHDDFQWISFEELSNYKNITGQMKHGIEQGYNEIKK